MVSFILLASFGLFGVIASAEEDMDCPAAPSIAEKILEDAGVKPRYGSGEDGGNYISDVAGEMTKRAMFPAYDWYGEWDGETYVEKCDKDAYYQAIYNYLVGMGADLPTGLSVEYVADIADGFVCQDIRDLEGNNPTAVVKDIHGNPVEGLEMRASIIREKDFPGSEFTDAEGKVSFGGLSYDKPGTYQLRIWIKDPEIRAWANTSALSREFELRHDMIGTWELRADRLIVIDQQDGDAFSGILTDDNAKALGNISGSLDGDSIFIYYDRIGYATDGYFAEFTGTMDSCDSASGTRKHGNNGVYRSDIANWTITRL